LTNPTAGIARRERPRCRAAEKRDELAPPDPSCHVMPQIYVLCPL
jgi:hypothetical protein